MHGSKTPKQLLYVLLQRLTKIVLWDQMIEESSTSRAQFAVLRFQNVPGCLVGKSLGRSAPQHAPVCQPRTWQSSIWCCRQKGRFCWTWGTCKSAQHPHRLHQPYMKNGGKILSLILGCFQLRNVQKEVEVLCVRNCTLSKIGYLASKRVQTNWTISSFVPGSCPPNWLHGKARISKPEVTHQILGRYQ